MNIFRDVAVDDNVLLHHCGQDWNFISVPFVTAVGTFIITSKTVMVSVC